MNTSLSAFLDIYVFPTGRRIFALRQVAERAASLGFGELATHCQAALEHDLKCYALERKWASLATEAKSKTAPAEGGLDAATLDPLVDRTLTALRDAALSQTAGAPAGDPIHTKVASFLKAIVPTGNVNDITGLSMVEEDVAVGAILALLQGSLAADVTDLGLGRLVTRLGDLHTKYHAALTAPGPQILAFSDVKGARTMGQELLLEAIAITIGKHHGRGQADVDARNTLLGPIFEQNDAVGAAMRGRRTVVDVDPDTGNPDATPPVPPAPIDPAKPA